MSETFQESVERIQKDHNISEREAVRVALSMERLAARRTAAEES